MMMDIALDDRYVIVYNDKPAQIVKFMGSDIWKCRYKEGNKTKVFSFTTQQIDWGILDPEALKKKYS